MALTLKLKDFNGPLDMLLFMNRRGRIDIKDIFVSEVTDQYIRSVREADDMDMDEASSFIQMAATLLEIKSRSLLPAGPKGRKRTRRLSRSGSWRSTRVSSRSRPICRALRRPPR